jgi:hypothetical protein
MCASEIQGLALKGTEILPLPGRIASKFLMEDGTSKNILKWKYIGSKALSQVYWKTGDSHF